MYSATERCHLGRNLFSGLQQWLKARNPAQLVSVDIIDRFSLLTLFLDCRARSNISHANPVLVDWDFPKPLHVLPLVFTGIERRSFSGVRNIEIAPNGHFG